MYDVSIKPKVITSTELATYEIVGSSAAKKLSQVSLSTPLYIPLLFITITIMGSWYLQYKTVLANCLTTSQLLATPFAAPGTNHTAS